MKTLSISMDVEPDLHTLKYESIEALSGFLKLLEKYNVKATFFTTCDCIEKNPRIFKLIREKGHEINLHGYKHVRFDNLNIKEKETHIKKSIALFQKYLKIIPRGFRAPQHSIDEETLQILEKNKFNYDSSLIPWNFYHLVFFWKIKVKFSHNFTRMKPYKIKNNLFEIPISSFVLPFSSVTLRVLPKPLLAVYFWLISSYKNPVFLMHSWDLIEIPESKICKLCPKEKYLERFEYMLRYFSKKGEFVSVESLARD